MLPEIKIDELDRITWLIEKSGYTLFKLAIVFELTETEEIEESTKEKIQDNLGLAISDHMKVFLALNGYPYGYNKGEFVNSKEKYWQLLENYNIAGRETSNRNKKKADDIVYLKILKLLNESKKYNRTFVNEEINTIQIKTKKFQELRDLVEMCNFNEISWNIFCEQAREIIENN